MCSQKGRSLIQKPTQREQNYYCHGLLNWLGQQLEWKTKGLAADVTDTDTDSVLTLNMNVSFDEISCTSK